MSTDFDAELVRGSLVPIVLALLSEHEQYGYELARVVDARSGGRLALREGTLYPILHRLEAEGLISSRWASSPEGRQRKYYVATRRGRSEAEKLVGQLRSFYGAVEGVLKGGAA
jgi:DNA-binding PadR family transcriptional regulator